MGGHAPTHRAALCWFELELNSSPLVTSEECVHGNVHIRRRHRSSPPFVTEVGEESDTEYSLFRLSLEGH